MNKEINDLINQYVNYVNTLPNGLQEHVTNEKFKFEDVERFQNNFNLDAPDLFAMLEKSIVHDPLSAGGQYFPTKMLLEFAKFNSSKLRNILTDLLDESTPISERVKRYIHEIESVNDERNKSFKEKAQSYHDARFISLILSLKYPNKYMYFKSDQIRKTLEKLSGSKVNLGSDAAQKIIKAQNIGQEIAEYLKNNSDAQMIKAALTDGLKFKDIDNLWLAEDVYYSIDHLDTKDVDSENIQSKFWIFQGNPDIFDIEKYLSENVNKKIDWSANQSSEDMHTGDIVYFWASKGGGLAGIGELISEPYDRSSDDNEARFGSKKIDIKLLRYFVIKDRVKRSDLVQNSILSKSKIAVQPQASNFLLTNDESFELQKIIAKKRITQVWLFTPGEKARYLQDVKINQRIRIGWDKLGNLRDYDNRDEIKRALTELYSDGGNDQYNNTSACDDFLNKIQLGDIVILKSGQKRILGIGHITGDYEYNDDLENFKNMRLVKFSKFGEWDYDPNEKPLLDNPAKHLPLKTMTDITQYPEFIERIANSMATDNNKVTKGAPMQNEEALNTILYGPPGTGKTYEALQRAKELLSNNKYSQSSTVAYAEVTKDLSWKQIVALTMYRNGKENTYKISQLKTDPLIQAYATTKSSKDHGATMTTTVLESATSGSTLLAEKYKKNEEFFHKHPESHSWSLSADGIDFVEDGLIEYLNKIDQPEQPRTDWKQFQTIITFHQSYSYEEFVEGIRPVVNDSGDITYEVKPGVFKQICQKAINDPENKYLLVIDEINRGNISKIFGELITIIEEDKRTGGKNEIKITLPYSGELFSVPKNLHVIGTMNTADRSIALLDVALRRRFHFEELMPKSSLVSDVEIDGLNIGTVMHKLNDRIEVMIDRDHMIGHSYFLKIKEADNKKLELKEVWDNDITPLICEYFYNDWDRIKSVLGKKNEQGGFVEMLNETNIKERFNDGSDSEEFLDKGIGKIHKYNEDNLISALKNL